MDKKLQIVQYLFDEAEHPAEVQKHLREDSELWAEYQAISEAKFQLDHSHHHRPDPRVLQNILNVAAGSGDVRSIERRGDRRAIPHYAKVRKARVWGVVGTVLTVAVFLVVGIKNYSTTSPASTVTGIESVMPAGRAVSSPNVEIPPTIADRILADRIQAKKGISSILIERSEEDLDWNESEEMLELYRRIEMLRSGVDNTWDELAPPLESFPVDTQVAAGRTELQLAGQRNQ